MVQTQAQPGGWRSEERGADFFSARAVLEAVLGVAGVDVRAHAGEVPFLHPGRAAFVVAAGGERNIGWVGELHPQVARAWDLVGPVAGFEIDLDAVAELTEGTTEVYGDVTSFPAVLQDIAVVVGDDVPAAAVVEAVRGGAGPLLAEVALFDVYRGEQAGEGRKSLALRLEFRSPERTLTDEEAARLREQIVDVLSERFGAELRA
jgi:phenylalanyl-tRNA synthetase beta chain